MNARAWRLALATAALMALLAGARAAFGLFASQAPTGSGVGLALATRPSPMLAAEPAVGGLASAPVETSQREASSGFDGVVEAVRQSVVAAQVSGAVTAIEVKVGDRSRPARWSRIDARTPNRMPPPVTLRCIRRRLCWTWRARNTNASSSCTSSDTSAWRRWNAPNRSSRRRRRKPRRSSHRPPRRARKAACTCCARPTQPWSPRCR